MSIINILFLTIGTFCNIEEHSLYSDLLRSLRDKGYNIYTVTPCSDNEKTTDYRTVNGVNMLQIKTPKIKSVSNLISKGISTLLVEPLFIGGIKKYFKNVKFDLVLYSTPPITFCNAVNYVKKRDNAKSYLLLKDIFPQNAIDLDMISKCGIKGLVYKYFRLKEKKLYKISDKIGCMSKANADYILKNNPQISPTKVEIFPNCVDIVDMRIECKEKQKIREEYGFPENKKIFVYGGNLGIPQDIPFFVECLKKCADLKNAYFVIAGRGTQHSVLENYINTEKPANVRFLGRLPKLEYERMMSCADVGLIFLDHRFTVPNFPSRLLSYMQAGLPIISCTDSNTDIGDTVLNGDFGWKCESNSTDDFKNCVIEALNCDLTPKSQNSFKYLLGNYDIKKWVANIESFDD